MVRKTTTASSDPTANTLKLPAILMMNKSFFLAALLLSLACAAPASTPPAPAPVPVADGTVARIPASAIPHPTPLPIEPLWRPVSSALADIVPEFQTAPLITWGPLPPGVPHEERARTYDLVHQVVRVAFDWTRQATVLPLVRDPSAGCVARRYSHSGTRRASGPQHHPGAGTRQAIHSRRTAPLLAPEETMNVSIEYCTV